MLHSTRTTLNPEDTNHRDEGSSVELLDRVSGARGHAAQVPWS